MGLRAPFVCTVICVVCVVPGTLGRRTEAPPAGDLTSSPPPPPEGAAGDLLPGPESYDPQADQVSCRQRNKCSRRPPGVELDFYDQNCFCDDLCKLYGDCCKDYRGSLPGTLPEGFRLARRTLSCSRVISIDATAEIYRVDKCPSNYEDAFVREKCENAHSLDQFLLIPVSGLTTGVLYKNYYCAVCSGDTNVTFWSVKWQCETGPDLGNLTHTEKLLEDVWIMGAGNCIYEFTHPTMTYRKCKSHLSRCPKLWEGDRAVEQKCRETSSYVYLDSTTRFMVFGNEYCAQCYNINSTYLTCRDPRGLGIREPRPPPTKPFSILLDIPTGSGVVRSQVGDDTRDMRVTFRQCQEHHVYDPFSKICRRISCPAGEVFGHGDCISEAEAARTTISVSYSTNRRPATTTRRAKHTTPAASPRPTPQLFYTVRPAYPTPYGDDDRKHSDIQTYLEEHSNSDPLLDCPLETYTQDEYTKLENGSVLVTLPRRVVGRDSYLLRGTTLYICAPLNATDSDWTYNGQLLMFQFDRIEKLVCLIGLLVSLLFLLICFVIHLLLPPLRTVPGRCIIALATCLFLSHAVFLLTVLEVGVSQPVVCQAMGIGMHYLFMVAFCWTNCMAVDLCNAIGRSRLNDDKGATCRYTSYSVYSWLFPALWVGACAVADYLDFSSIGGESYVDMFRPSYGRGVCWISRRNGLIFLFALPLGALFVVNIITYLVTVHRMRTRPAVGKAAARRDKDKNRLLINAKYAVILALTWAFGLLAVMIDTTFLWYIFIVFMALQGAFLCAAFVCTRKVFRLLKNLGRVHKTTSPANGTREYHRAYSTATAGDNNPWGYSRSNFLYEDMGDAKVISQETSI